MKNHLTPTQDAWADLISGATVAPTERAALAPTAHPFAATLGPGPYSLEKSACAASNCAHCGRPIKNLYMVRIGSGEIKPVGSECILKLTHQETARLVATVKREKRFRESERRTARKAAKAEEARKVMLAQTEKEYGTEAAWLSAFSGFSSFLDSLKGQLAKNGGLSPRQWECVRDAIAKQSAPKPEKVFTLKVGETIIVSKFFARLMGKRAGLNRPHFALEVLEVKAETERAYLGRFRTSAVRTAHCCVCGILLKNPQSVANGIGPICGGAYDVENLEQLAEKLRTVDAVLESWIPKSQIKEVKKL